MIRKDLPFIISFILIGVLIRLLLQNQMLWSYDSDEAIVGLMARHIKEGGEIPVFYYGQHYMGSFEPLMVSWLYKLFGISVFTLRAVPTFFYILLFPLIYSVGYRMGGIKVARSATVLLAFTSISFAEWSVRARGGFIETVFFCLLALYLAAADFYAGKKIRSFTTFVTGLLIGFGWWTNNQIIFAMVPVGLFYLMALLLNRSEPFLNRIKNIFIHGITGTAGFLAGSLPFWIDNFQTGFASLGMFKFSDRLAKNIAGYFSEALPIVLGVKRFWTSEEVFPGDGLISSLVYGIIIIALVISIYKKYREKSLPAVTLELMLIGFIAFASLIFMVSSFGALYAAPRYLLPLYPAIYLLISFSLFSPYAPVKKISLPLLALVVLINSATYFQFNGNGFRMAAPGEPFIYEQERASRDHSELINWLLANDYRYVKTNYWIGYRLALETEEKIKFVQFGEPFQPRIQEYETIGKKQKLRSVPMIMTPKQGDLVEKGLSGAGFSYNHTSLSGYDVIFNVKQLHEDNNGDTDLRLIPPDAFALETNKRPEQIGNIVDHNLNTRWGTGEHQQKGQFIRIKFNSPQTLRGLEIETAGWRSDHPRALMVTCVKPDNTRHIILDEHEAKGISYVFNADDINLHFPAVECSQLIFNQDGYHPVFDWSVAEMRIYQ